MSKNDRVRRMDLNRGTAGAGEIISESGSILPPAQPLPPAPQDLTVGSMTIGRSSQSAIAIVPLSWYPPIGPVVSAYLVEVADDSGFTSMYLRQEANSTGPVEISLPVNRTFYARVYAKAGTRQSAASNVVTFTTPVDTSPAAQPTSVSAAFIGSGDLRIAWTNPTNENFRDVEVRIWESSSKTTLYFTGYSTTGSLIWTAAQNRAAGSGTPDPSVYYELRSRTWSLVLNSTSPPSGTVTKAVPSAPTISVDFTGPDAVFSITLPADVVNIRLTPDTSLTARLLGPVGRFVYTLDQNRIDHSGTPDPSLAWSVVAIDGLDQSSTATTGTATNAAPSAPASVTLTGGFSAFMASVAATEPADFLTYRWRLIQTSPSAGDITWDSPSTLQTREVGAAATYQVGVKVMDIFGQLSSETLSSTTALDALTLADLRSDATYRDSDTNTFTPPASGTLAVLKDGNTGSGGVTYSA